MSFAKQLAKMARENPITDKYRLHSAFLQGALDAATGNSRPPLHPQLSAEYYAGRDCVAQGYIRIEGDEGADQMREMIAHVRAGNPRHTFTPGQRSMAL